MLLGQIELCCCALSLVLGLFVGISPISDKAKIRFMYVGAALSFMAVPNAAKPTSWCMPAPLSSRLARSVRISPSSSALYSKLTSLVVKDSYIRRCLGRKDCYQKRIKLFFFRNILINVRQNYIYINCNYMVNLNRIKVVLVEKDKTGKWLSEQLSKSTCDVSKWCKNTVQPDLNTLDKITKLLDVDVTYLLNATEKD